jgi:hypothetical protein
MPKEVSPPRTGGVDVGEAEDGSADFGKVSPTSVVDTQTSIFRGGKDGAGSPPETSPAVSRQTSPKQSDGTTDATVIHLHVPESLSELTLTDASQFKMDAETFLLQLILPEPSRTVHFMRKHGRSSGALSAGRQQVQKANESAADVCTAETTAEESQQDPAATGVAAAVIAVLQRARSGSPTGVVPGSPAVVADIVRHCCHISAFSCLNG